MLLALTTAGYLWVVASLTLGRQPAGANGVLSLLGEWFAGYPATAWITYPVLEFTANIVLFLPAGAIWVLWFGLRRWWLAAAAGLVLSGAIEAAQALLLIDRVPDARDLVANTLGASAGAGAAAGLLQSRPGRPHTGRP